MSKKRPIILVTNDDGIVAPGIKALIEVAQEFGRVVVIAPDKPQSGQGHAITLNNPLRLRKVDLFGDIEAYECSGTPVDCVKLGKHVLLKEEEVALCVSGVNHGSNASINIIYSGTMSAAMEASLEGIDSIGFSLLDFSFDADFEPAKHFARIIIRKVLENGMMGCKLLNVNIPAVSKEEIKGVKVCKQAEGIWVEEFKEAQDPRGESYFWLTGEFRHDDDSQESDILWLKENYVTIVPSHHDLTHYGAMKDMDWLNE